MMSGVGILLDSGEGDLARDGRRSSLERPSDGEGCSLEGVNVMNGVLDAATMSSFWRFLGVGVTDECLPSIRCCSSTDAAASGATKVSGARDDRRPRRLLRRLLPLPFDCGRGPVFAGFVGVGGRSSVETCESSFAVGELLVESSPSMLKKLLRRTSLP